MLFKHKFTFLALAGLLFSAGSFTLIDFFQFTLPDLNNNPTSFQVLRKNKATAVIFLLSDCPASQSYTLTLNNLSKKYAKDGITFIGIFPGKFSTDDELKSFQKNYKVGFPLYKDPEMSLVRHLKATVAPQCFLIGDKSQILYKGRIDDWLFALGKKRVKITENNLDDAIKSVIGGTPVKITETTPIGCFLEYE